MSSLAGNSERTNRQERPSEVVAKVDSNRWADWLWHGWIALCLALLLNLLTGLIIDARWYSANPVLRWQTNAFFRGQTALSSSPGNVPYDAAWEHGVQQVWGLGVPAFRFPFELLARLFGQRAFPDRLTFLIACALCYWFLIRTFAGQYGEVPARLGSAERWKAMRVPWVVALLVLAPPFVTLVKARFAIYEEVVAYGYLYCLALFAGFLRVARRPKIAGFLLLGLWAGLGAWIRPTLFFYGLASVALAAVIAWSARVGFPTLIGMLGLFGLCGALLGCCNLSRFGGFFEFGHRLNLESGLNWNTFSLKFDYPFRNEPFVSAARDELGTLFFNKKLNGGDFYAPDTVWGQSPTLRWHEMYFTTFNIVYLALLIASVALWAWRFNRIRVRWVRNLAAGWQAGEPFDAARLKSGFALFAAPWAALSFVSLFGFYLWSPSMSSRYNIDFLPAVMIGISALVWNGFELNLIRERSQAVQWLTATAAWMAVGIFAAKICPGYGHQSANRAGVQPPISAAPLAQPPAELRHYELARPGMTAGLSFNGDGWDLESGAVQPAVTLFATAPRRVALSLFGPPGRSLTPQELAPIEAKIGLEHLARESLTIQSNRATLVYRGPQRPRYQTGLQVCFLKFIHAEDLGRKLQTLRLAAVSFAATNSSAVSLVNAARGN